MYKTVLRNKSPANLGLWLSSSLASIFPWPSCNQPRGFHLVRMSPPPTEDWITQAPLQLDVAMWRVLASGITSRQDVGHPQIWPWAERSVIPLPLGPFLLAGLQLWGCWAMPPTMCLTTTSLGAAEQQEEKKPGPGQPWEEPLILHKSTSSGLRWKEN